MSKFSNAAIQSFTLEGASYLEDRLGDERRNYDRMSDDERRICDDFCHKLRLWWRECDDAASMAAMMKCGVDLNFINTKGVMNRNNAEKIYKLAPYMARVTGKLPNYMLPVIRTLYQFTQADKGATSEHLMASLDHHKCADDDAHVWRLANKAVGLTTSRVQYLSSLVALKVWNIAVEYTCAETGKKLYKLDMKSAGTKIILERLGLSVAA